MSSTLDSYLFVNKSARSESLSRSGSDEKCDIQSHIQAKRHKNCKTSKRSRKASQSHTTLQNVRVSPASVSPSTATDSGSPGQRQQDVHQSGLPWNSPPLIPRDPLCDVLDPFNTTAPQPTKATYHLLRYAFSSFAEVTSQGESLDRRQDVRSRSVFRHRYAISERLRRCQVDNLTMLTTLAYSSSCIKWATGEQEEDRPPELYILESVKALRSRLQVYCVVDSWLILSIYALAACELWTVQNQCVQARLDTCGMHLRTVAKLVNQMGGWDMLDPYLMEGIILTVKYLALCELAPPVIPCDWDPGPLSKKLISQVRKGLDPELRNLGVELTTMPQGTFEPALIAIIEDTISCFQTAYHTWDQIDMQAYIQRWLFLRQNALVYRLLSFKSATRVQECLRLALLLWILKVTPSFGAQRSCKRILPRIKTAFIECQNDITEGQLPMMLWVTSMSAMAAEYTTEREFFLLQTRRQAFLIDPDIDKDTFRRMLRRHLFLPLEDGLQFLRLLRGVTDALEPAG